MRFGSDSSPKKREPSAQTAKFPNNQESYDGLSPELIPIVTLLSSQLHRRYHEGIFMLYYDLNGDGKPADRDWKEVYGILTGNQLAYWDASNLAQYRDNPEALLETSSKPKYINFTDSVYNAMRSLPAAKQNLDNVVIVSTTLKNRYILQFKSYADLTTWYAALRLANYEYSSLQEAYTGALLSARGSRLSDIRTILAEKRFDHEDWVSIRYGSGMAWKRCYAVVEPCTNKKKNFTPGRILFYENEHKKKKQLMAVVSNASSVAAVYPQSHSLIDHSTMLKLEGFINFKSPSLSTKVSKKDADDFKNTSIFLMPEQHSAVPGFDTLIRFLVPLLDSFGLYGRPTRLKADRVDPESLLFGLPTLPHVHYLEVSDVTQLIAAAPDFLSWDVKAWSTNIRRVMKSKLDRGYEGCGSQRGVVGAISSLNSPITSSSQKLASPQSDQFSRSQSSLHSRGPPPPQQLSPQKPRQEQANPHNRSHTERKPPFPNNSNESLPKATAAIPNLVANGEKMTLSPSALTPDQIKNNHKSVQLDDIYHKYSTMKTPSDQFHTDRNQLLNGSYEEFSESEMPANIRQLSLGNTYPKNDDELFSESDDESESEKIDSRRIGMNSSSSGNIQTTTLSLPSAGGTDRSSSYSSVHSPMTQYNDFNQQFSSAVKTESGLGKKPINSSNFSGFSDSDDDDAPIPPLHTSGPAYPQSDLRLSNGPKSDTLKTTRQSDSSYHSESGKVVNSVNSSPDSRHSPTKKDPVAPYPSLPPLQQTTNKPKYITSPNSTQNQAPRFPDQKRQEQKPLQLPELPPQQRNAPGAASSPQKQGLPSQNMPGYPPNTQPKPNYPPQTGYSSAYPQPGNPPRSGHPQAQPSGYPQPGNQPRSGNPPGPQPRTGYPQPGNNSRTGYPQPSGAKPPGAGYPQPGGYPQLQGNAPPQQYQRGPPPPSQQYRGQAPPSAPITQQAPQQFRQGAPPQQQRVGIPRSTGQYPHPQAQNPANLRGYDNSSYQYQYTSQPNGVPPQGQPQHPASQKPPSATRYY